MKLEFSTEIFEKFSNTKFHENPSSGSRIVPYGRTDGRRRTDRLTITKNLTVSFRNFAHAPDNKPRTLPSASFLINHSQSFLQSTTHRDGKE